MNEKLDIAVRRVIYRFRFLLDTPYLRKAALAVIDDAYPSEPGRIRAQQHWRDEVLKEYRALV